MSDANIMEEIDEIVAQMKRLLREAESMRRDIREDHLMLNSKRQRLDAILEKQEEELRARIRKGEELKVMYEGRKL